ncbi:MAG: hypothetical protein LBJ18_02765 [Rickettsiales bacterium]|jgi:DTW domain-containing protein YfiP|nr:hypothetical protein [Rickettsiales bacterium]
MQQKDNKITGDDKALAVILQAEAELLNGAKDTEAAEKLLNAFNKINKAVLDFKNEKMAEINRG